MQHEIRSLGAALPLGAIFVLGLLGCGSEPSTADAPEGLVTRETDDDGGDSAMLQGTVTQLEGCFYIEDAHPEGELWVAVFPSDIVAEPSAGDGFSLNGQDYNDGDQSTVGGSRAVEADYPAPEECDEEAPQWQVHPEG
ncbi:hypothetical protein [Nesterenkonia sp. Act20]|uniref:hypothetical protein n=1 Tax=Nesterenkonia sp. Act20 TaxID=1483432 RepID=UPI001C4372B9|nr:hypothetical protein [Nesterenkonia sp. Act20]